MDRNDNSKFKAFDYPIELQSEFYQWVYEHGVEPGTDNGPDWKITASTLNNGPQLCFQDCSSDEAPKKSDE